MTNVAAFGKLQASPDKDQTRRRPFDLSNVTLVRRDACISASKSDVCGPMSYDLPGFRQVNRNSRRLRARARARALRTGVNVRAGVSRCRKSLVPRQTRRCQSATTAARPLCAVVMISSSRSNTVTITSNVTPVTEAGVLLTATSPTACVRSVQCRW